MALVHVDEDVPWWHDSAHAVHPCYRPEPNDE
jgi:hypothetical protein